MIGQLGYALGDAIFVCLSVKGTWRWSTVICATVDHRVFIDDVFWTINPARSIVSAWDRADHLWSVIVPIDDEEIRS